jgi:hypothetical protein
MHRVDGNNISNFHLFDIKTLYLFVLYTKKNASTCLRYYVRTRYDICFFMEMDKNSVWYPMKQMVPLQWIPNITYTNNQTYKNLLVKRANKVFCKSRPRKLGLPR